MPKTPSCTFHCASCDMHCSSLVAFDAHRQNGGCRLKPVNMPSRQFITRQGVCNLTKGQIGQKVPADIWGLPWDAA